MRLCRTLLMTLLIGAQITVASEPLKISDCYQKAENNYPTKKQIGLYNSIYELKTENLNTRYFPSINLLGQAQYQSDVTKIDIKIPIPNFTLDIPEMPKDQYKVGVNMEQLIWDGGITSAQKGMDAVQNKINAQTVEIDLYTLRQKVNDSFFAILMLQEQLKSLNTIIADLTEKGKIVKSAVDNGVLLQSNFDIIQAQIAKVGQSIEEAKANKSAAFNILSELINEPLGNDTQLEMPDAEFDLIKTTEKKRPEYELFKLTKENLHEAESLISAKNLPKISAYGQAFYARPGLNMFDDTFQPYYILGIRASWNLWDWNAASKEIEIAKYQQDIVDTQEEAFQKNLSLASKRYAADIEKLGNIIEKDKEIIALQEKIVRQTSSQLDNGVITATEYLTEYNEAVRAKLALEIHKIQLIQTKYNYMTLLGGL